MLNSILSLLGLTSRTTPAERETEAMRAIGEALERLDADLARYIAAMAYILSRVAYSDHSVHERETDAMERLVREHSSLSGPEATLVVQIARTQNRLFRGTEDFLVTRVFNELATPAQKVALIECLYAVSAADGAILTVEDNEIQRIAKELKVEHADVVRIRSTYRESLKVLREDD